MLHAILDLKGYSLSAADGEIGKVTDVYFDDLGWVVRYLVVKTGWLAGREVLIAASAIENALPGDATLTTKLTTAQIEASPPIEADPPLSRQYERRLYEHYGWNPYWGMPVAPGIGLYGYEMASVPSPGALSESARRCIENEHEGDAHLRSCREVAGYAIHATDGNVGHVEDFLIQPGTWAIEYLVIDTRNWLPGKKVLAATGWVGDIDWFERQVSVRLSKQDLQNAPAFDPESLRDATFESTITIYFHGLVQKWRDALGGGDSRSGRTLSSDARTF